MPAKPTTTAEYLAPLTRGQREAFATLRKAILAAAPIAEEAFSYRMPAFKLNGKSLVWIAVWKDHYSMYPVTAPMLRAYASEVKGYEASGKGTIHFPADKPLPLGLVKKLVKFRVAELKKLASAAKR